MDEKPIMHKWLQARHQEQGLEVRKYWDKARTRRTSFTMTKVIEYEDHSTFLRKVELLQMLKSETFNRIMIPNFTFCIIEPGILQICSEYIKGRYPNRKEMEIIKEDLVYRESEYSFGDYNINNFIVEGIPPSEIYVIDLDSFTKIPMENRIQKFAKRQEQYERYFEWYA